MKFNITNHIEICDLDSINTSFHSGIFYCLALKIKPTLCPSKDWITIFSGIFKMRGYEGIELIRNESFFIFCLPVDGIGFYEAKSTIKDVISVVKITNEKLKNFSSNQGLKPPLFGEDLGSLLFDSFINEISHE